MRDYRLNTLSDRISVNLCLWFLILLINVLVYLPSFSHPARSDQFFYLCETVSYKNVGDLFTHTSSFNRTRVYQKGDEILFRPLFFLFLAVERQLFGYDFFNWQLVGFGLHLSLLLVLWRLLYSIRQSFLAWFVVLNFSVLFLGQEMVIWHHIHAYILFSIMMVQALYHCLCFLRSHGKENKHLIAAVGLLIVGSFIHEFAVLACVCFAVWFYVWCRISFQRIDESGKGRLNPARAVVFLIPIAIYLTANALDYCSRVGGSLNSGGYVFNPGQFLLSLVSLPIMWLKGVLFPYFMNISIPGQRSILYGFTFDRRLYDLWGLSNVCLAMLAVFLIAFVGVHLFKHRRILPELFKKKVASIGFLSIFLAGAYVFLIVGGRLSEKAMVYVQTGLYHFYIISLLMAVGAYCLFFAVERVYSRHQKWLRAGIAALLLGLTVINGHQSFAYNTIVAEKFYALRHFLSSLDHFVQTHKNEKDFSFVVRHSTVSVSASLNEGTQKMPKLIKAPLYEYLFVSYVDKSAPKYSLVYGHDGLLRIFRKPPTSLEF